MEIFEKYKLRASKRTLLFLAGVVWSVAGERVVTLGYRDFSHAEYDLWFDSLLALIICYVFLRFIFRRIVKKHITRIMTSSLTDHCVFAFFDLRGYVMMVVMITAGITIRKAQIVAPLYLGTFYLGLGVALFSAGVMFLTAAIRYEKTKRTYAPTDETARRGG